MIEHKTKSLADQVFEHIENAILVGKYQRGEIFTESKLSAELGVSRTPIREALRRLEQEHLIEETKKGIVIIGITEKDLTDIFLIREKLEGLAAALAAKNCTEEQLNELREVLELQEFYLSKNDADHIKSMDNQFHKMLYKLTGSMAFYETLVPLHKKIQKYRMASVQNKSRAFDSVVEHRKIFDAIESKDDKIAEQYAAEHVINAYNHIMRKD